MSTGDDTHGHERPIILTSEQIQKYDAKKTFRLQRRIDRGGPHFWGRRKRWSVWNGQDEAFHRD